MAATTFPLFSSFPKETRTQIWEEALPGPRIVYIQRHLRSGADPRAAWYEHRPDEPLMPTYFASSSPNGSISSLLLVCRESHTTVKRRYSLILPESCTWFSFAIDWLYLDWGGAGDVQYAPRHFSPSYPEWVGSHTYAHPEINPGIAAQVRRLAVFKSIDYHHRNLEIELIVKELLSVFTGVEVLVMADHFHDREPGVELTWLHGRLDSCDDGQSKVSREERKVFDQLILWRDSSQYFRCAEVDFEDLKRRWKKYKGENEKMPKVFRNSIVTANVKQSMLNLCGSERQFRKLASLDWEYVVGNKEYLGNLGLSQQISFLELALGQLALKDWCDFARVEKEGANISDIIDLTSKIEALVVEREMLDLIILDAEETRCV